MSKLAEILRKREPPPATPATPATRQPESSKSSESSSPPIPESEIEGRAAGARACARCLHFGGPSGSAPDGSCRRYAVETWATVPFTCTGYEPADHAARELERRHRKVLADLAAHPERRVSADVADAPLRPEPGAPVSIVIACRTGAGIASAELAVPRERFDAALFLKTLTETSRRPS